MRRALIALALLAVALAEAAPSDILFRRIGDFPLGAATDRMDYQSMDPSAHRLYIAGMGRGQLIVFDTEKNALVRTLDGFPKTTGVLAVPEKRRVYASVPGAGLVASLEVGLGMLGLTSGSGAVAVVDTTDLHVIARLPGGVFPDGLAYDANDDRLFVSDELGSAVLAYDASRNGFLARIVTGGQVGNVRYDPGTHRVFVPVQSKNVLAVIDPVTLKLVAQWPLAGCEHPHGLMLHWAKPVAYVACDENNVLVTVDLVKGRVMNRIPVASDPDVLAIDPGLRRVYAAGESGELSTYDLTNAGSPVALGTVDAGPNAHSVAVDPTTHRLYLPLANLSGQAVMRVMAPSP